MINYEGIKILILLTVNLTYLYGLGQFRERFVAFTWHLSFVLIVIHHHAMSVHLPVLHNARLGVQVFL